MGKLPYDMLAQTWRVLIVPYMVHLYMVPVMVQSYRPSASICHNDGAEENLIDDCNNCSEKDTLI